MAPGGGAVASELGGKVEMINCALASNNAPNGNGGAILVGGTRGIVFGAPGLALNQAFLSVTNCACGGNTDQSGIDSTDLLDPAGLGGGDNGVKFVTNGGCPLGPDGQNLHNAERLAKKIAKTVKKQTRPHKRHHKN